MSSIAMLTADRTGRSQWKCRWWSSLAAVAVSILGLGAQRSAALPCVGDCNANGSVVINELIVGVTIALGSRPLSACEAFACQGDGTVPINCLIQAVNSALNGCAGPPTVALTGSCALPGSGSRGLKSCDPGTPLTIYRCDDRSLCLHQQGLTVVGTTTVESGGGWSVQIPVADASEPLIVHAAITTTVAYRALAFGSARAFARAGVSRATTFTAVAITPVSEAAVELLDTNGFANYSDAGAQQVLAAVESATAALAFDGDTPEMAVSVALQTASADATVVTVLQNARNTPIPTGTSTSGPTGTPTVTPTAPPSRFVDNGDGTITDAQTGLMWEKKDQAGGLNQDQEYHWAGTCSDDSGICQPNAAAAATCSAATGNAIGCTECAGAATCYTSGTLTIWDWLNQLNAANFAGHDDWRIPTIGQDGGRAELETIVDRSVTGCGTGRPCVPPAFNTACTNRCTVTTCSCTVAGLYWSATAYAGFPTASWGQSFYGGDFDLAHPLRASTSLVRAVRGGS